MPLSKLRFLSAAVAGQSWHQSQFSEQIQSNPFPFGSPSAMIQVNVIATS
jgi:hypothetical protein